MDFVAFELFAYAVRPREQIQNVGGRFEIEEPQCLVAGNLAATQNTLAEFGDFVVRGRVN